MASAVRKVSNLVPFLIKGVQEQAIPGLRTAWKYAKVEMKPPTPGEWPQIAKGFENLFSAVRSRKWKQLTVKEAFISAVITTEVACWFFIGECIGKGSIIGYQVEGATSFAGHM